MPVLKRPASSQPSGSVMKKPASGGGSIKDVVNALNEEINKEKETQDEEGGDSELRDKQKSQKFHKMLSSGTLPEHIVHMFNVESKKSKEGQRAYQTRLINQLFDKNKDGTFRVMTDKHEFQEYRKIFHRQVAKDKTEALPRTIMLASNFHGNEALMKKAIDNGELISKVDKETKVEYLQFRKLSSAEIRGNETGETVQGNRKINREMAHIMADTMSKLKWKFHLTKAGQFALSVVKVMLGNFIKNYSVYF